MRKYCGFILLAGTLALVGCGKEDSSTTSTPDKNANPKDGYLGAVVNAQQSSIKKIDTAALNQSIQLFNAQEGRNPKDLDELVTMRYIKQLPPAPAGMKLSYDAAQGKVSVVPQ